MKRIILMTPLLNYFDFFPKTFFPNFELPNLGCGLSANVVYPPVFMVILKKNLKSNNFTLGYTCNEIILARWKNYHDKHNLQLFYYKHFTNFTNY